MEVFFTNSIKNEILHFASGFTNSNSLRKHIMYILRLWVINNIKNINKIESLTMYSILLHHFKKLHFSQCVLLSKMVKYIK